MKKFTAITMAASLFAMTFGAADGYATVAPHMSQSEAPSASHEADLRSVQSALENKIVRKRLLSLGLTPKETEQRLSQLDQQQLHQVARRIEQQNPAGDAAGIALIAVGVALFVVLIVTLLRAAEDETDDYEARDRPAVDDDDDEVETAPQRTTTETETQETEEKREAPGTIIVK